MCLRKYKFDFIGMNYEILRLFSIYSLLGSSSYFSFAIGNECNLLERLVPIPRNISIYLRDCKFDESNFLFQIKALNGKTKMDFNQSLSVKNSLSFNDLVASFESSSSFPSLITSSFQIMVNSLVFPGHSLLRI